MGWFKTLVLLLLGVFVVCIVLAAHAQAQAQAQAQARREGFCGGTPNAVPFYNEATAATPAACATATTPAEAAASAAARAAAEATVAEVAADAASKAEIAAAETVATTKAAAAQAAMLKASRAMKRAAEAESDAEEAQAQAAAAAVTAAASTAAAWTTDGALAMQREATTKCLLTTDRESIASRYMPARRPLPRRKTSGVSGLDEAEYLPSTITTPIPCLPSYNDPDSNPVFLQDTYATPQMLTCIGTMLPIFTYSEDKTSMT